MRTGRIEKEDQGHKSLPGGQVNLGAPWKRPATTRGGTAHAEPQHQTLPKVLSRGTERQHCMRKSSSTKDLGASLFKQ
jgi:hypothetical protein